MLLAASAVAASAADLRYEFDGVSDDLLSAGLGAVGLRGPLPAFADPVQPTRAELRRRAVYQNYRGLVDLRAESGFGTRYGPRAGAPGIAGVEILTRLRAANGATTTAMLQIPRDFSIGKPCLIVAVSSGSRGIYGALPTAGEWGLKRGCAVVHTDKGTGMGLFDVDRGAGLRIDGTVTTDATDPLIGYAPDAAAVEALRRRAPHTLLLKHANSGVNPEADWGANVLQAAQSALQLLNRELKPKLDTPLTPVNTEVIAVGISNGGGAVLRALELDRGAMFDAAVVSEPNINVSGALTALRLRLRQGEGEGEGEGERVRKLPPLPLYDYATLHALLQPCAMLAESDATAPLLALVLLARERHVQQCAALARAGLVTGGDTDDQAREARDQLITAGVLPQALRLGPLNVQFELWLSVAATYASAYAGSGSNAMPCGFSFAATDAVGAPRPLTDAELAVAFSDGSGIAPTGSVSLVRDAGAGRSASAARSFDALQCLREQQTALRPAIVATESRARPGRRPVIVLHGRQDGLVPVNFSSRAYYQAVPKRSRSELRYYEVERGQHFDAFLPLPGMADRYVAMQPLLNDALDLVQRRLEHGTPLPPSQVVRTAIVARPGADAIRQQGSVLVIPE